MPLFDVPTATVSVDLPSLEGSDKQRNWAFFIRSRKMAEVQALIRGQRGLVETHRQAGRVPQTEAAQATLTIFIDGAGRLERERSARFWIDRRENTAHELLTGGAPARPGPSY